VAAAGSDRPTPRLVDPTIHAVAAIAVGLLLLLAGQPLFTDDLWIHLALGDAFLRDGPWLAGDPHLFTAPGPPPPSAWLADVFLSLAASIVGFQGLRVLHVVLAAVILTAVWRLLARSGGSSVWASAGLALFVFLSTYRVAQLRPHLFSILATLALFNLLWRIDDRRLIHSLGLGALLGTVWANLHPGFLLGPILAAGSSMALLLFSLPLPETARPAQRRRAVRMAALAGAVVLGTLANPQGIESHIAYFAAGGETPELSYVADEWGRVDLLSLPVANLPPSPVAWLICWLLLIATLAGGVACLRGWRRAGTAASPSPDPLFLAFSIASLGAMLLATRFLWMGVFPLAFAAATCRPLGEGAGRVARRVDRGLLACLLVLLPGFWLVGDWPMLSAAITVPGASYREAYPAGKYHGHAVWLLRDAGLEGHVYNDYSLGGFMSYWLWPRLKMFSSGTMNIRSEAMEVSLAISNRMGAGEGIGFVELLDREGVDLFLGSGLPLTRLADRPNIDTTRYLEGIPGWIPLFRNVRGAIFARDDERNAPNLSRIAAYYRAEGVPFDPARGFEVDRVIEEALPWAIARGVVPQDFAELSRHAGRAPIDGATVLALHRLSTLYAVLGLYERSLEIDLSTSWPDGSRALALRRILWSLLHEGRVEEAAALGRKGSNGMGLTGAVAVTAVMIAELPPEERDFRIAHLPLFEWEESGLVLTGLVQPAPRAPRGWRAEALVPSLEPDGLVSIGSSPGHR